jgi:glycosyltransferase involved in cell wall biosynthesis
MMSAAGAPMRVVYSVDADFLGGVERHLVTLVAHLDRRRYEPVVLGRAPSETRRELEDLNTEFVPVPEVTSKWDVRAWMAVLGMVRGLRPEVFHGMQSHSFSGHYALASAILARVPRVVVTCHLPTVASNRRQAQLASALRLGVDVQIVPGSWARNQLERNGQLARRTVIVPNGIDRPDLVPRAKARSMLGIAPGASVVGGLMRLDSYKRPDLVVDLARALPGVTAVVFGDGPDREHLAARARGSDVVLTGFRSDAAALISALDVVVHPCPEDNQPLAILEAMAGGVPVVVANQGGAADMVEHERTGLLAPVTREGMAAAVGRLLADKNLAGRLATAAAAHVQREANPETMTRRIEALYECDAQDVSPWATDADAEPVA